jgi:23S rRNA maturation mini-RNase III
MNPRVIPLRRRKLAGYQLHITENMPLLKAQQVPARERLLIIGKMWNALSEEEKNVWKTKAAQPRVIPLRRRKLAGYQLHITENMPLLKAQQVPARERLLIIGKMWNALSEEEKNVWKTKAAQL